MSRAASPTRATIAMAVSELGLAVRRGETLLATAVLPVVVLAFFSSAGILAVPGRPVDFLLPGSIAFAVVATSLVSLGITTAYDRHYGVLKRLGGSPLSREELVVAKIAAVLVVEAVQVVLLVLVAVLFLGWSAPAGTSPLGVGVAVLLGTLAFAGLGLLLAGLLRAETMLAAANALFVATLVVGGVVVPVDHLPEPLGAVAPFLPAAALSDALRAALDGTGTIVAGGPAAVLATWGVATVALTARTFRWD